MSAGKVFLVGAGPGDPDLLTRRAYELMQCCDVVCYDKLVSPAILACVPEHVQLYEVGYRGYKNCHIDYGMHPDVIDFALQGKQVLRLKAGDPCIFGRTTEECTNLRELGIEYEIIPGITAALGAAAYSGFPLTSAGVASDVTFVSGHQSSKTLSSWAALGQSSGTLVLYMGAKKLAQHASKLIEQGRCYTTPVAHISSATCANHTVTTGTLATIGEKVMALDNHDPALVIMGDVVLQAETLGWRHRLPLVGQRALVCGQYTSDRQLKEVGVEVYQAPEARLESWASTDLLTTLSQLPALQFTDVAAVKLWWQGLIACQWDLRRFMMPIGASHTAVTLALKERGIIVADVPKNTPKLSVIVDSELTEHNGNIVKLASEREVVRTASNSAAQYAIGVRRMQPLRFPLPDIQWLLVDDTAQADYLISQYEGLKQATIVALNDIAQEWAEQHGYHQQDRQIFEAAFCLSHEVNNVA
ncbi:uroporphyrinogen-III C-methyltransferase [Photobacterium nomapromontoriensis]|uniref:uroporphyrinogen-III C-methyltransferase n=1 Tax=Photobacterium nomapromontoriensis TaxID=2910237 RepID=UPI003D0B5C4C